MCGSLVKITIGTTGIRTKIDLISQREFVLGMDKDFDQIKERPEPGSSASKGGDMTQSW